MSDVREAVRERFTSGSGTVLGLANAGDHLRAHELDLGRVERRRHQPIGEDGPRRVERRCECVVKPNSVQSSVGSMTIVLPSCAVDSARRLARKELRCRAPTLEQERFDSLRRRRELLRAAEQVEVRGDDVVRGVAPQDHLQAVDVEAWSSRCRLARATATAGAASASERRDEQCDRARSWANSRVEQRCDGVSLSACAHRRREQHARDVRLADDVLARVRCRSLGVCFAMVST